MTDLPIPFSAPMVLGLIREVEHPGAGKTQTRRIKWNQRKWSRITALLCRRHFHQRPPTREGRFFPWTTGGGVYAWLKPLRERLGVTYRPHMNRINLATDADAAAIPEKRTAELEVWQDPSSLKRYQHVRPAPIGGRTIDKLLALPTVDRFVESAELDERGRNDSPGFPRNSPF